MENNAIQKSPSYQIWEIFLLILRYCSTGGFLANQGHPLCPFFLKLPQTFESNGLPSETTFIRLATKYSKNKQTNYAPHTAPRKEVKKIKMQRQMELIWKAWDSSMLSKISNSHLSFLEPVLRTGPCPVCLRYCCCHFVVVSELFYLWKLSASTLTVKWRWTYFFQNRLCSLL